MLGKDMTFEKEMYFTGQTNKSAEEIKDGSYAMVEQDLNDLITKYENEGFRVIYGKQSLLLNGEVINTARYGIKPEWVDTATTVPREVSGIE